MATNNFKSVNPTAIYALQVDDDGDMAREQVEYVQGEIIETLKRDYKIDVREQDCASSDNDRNYGGWLYGMAYGPDNGSYEYVTVELLTRNGYYDGVNFDYIVGYLVNGDEYDDEDLEGASVYNERKGDYVDISKTRVKKLRADAKRITKAIDKTLAGYTASMKKVGQFSNGEAVYERN